MTASGQVFHFKKFDIYQDNSAMKVGTDAVLLGAWINVKAAKNILDVGSGTGLIALMLAQRNTTALIDAVEIDKDAAEQTRYNFEISPWKNRLFVTRSDFLQFQKDIKYDLIVSNPPYFDENFHSKNHQRDLARHSRNLNLNDFIKKSVSMLQPNGRIGLILPLKKEKELQEILFYNKLYINKITYVKGNLSAPVKRFLCEISFEKHSFSTDILSIELSRHRYTPEYIALTKAFYLKM
jgi:tRNA1Val (adenine37-N6)-methyltransferase